MIIEIDPLDSNTIKSIKTKEDITNLIVDSIRQQARKEDEEAPHLCPQEDLDIVKNFKESFAANPTKENFDAMRLSIGTEKWGKLVVDCKKCFTYPEIQQMLKTLRNQ